MYSVCRNFQQKNYIKYFMDVQRSYSSLFSFSTGILIPLLLWVAFTPWSAELDLKISHVFYYEGAFVSNRFWDWVFIYALWPAWIVFFAAILGYILSFKRMYHSWRIPCIYLILTFGIGSGLIVHAILKEHWGRPRPRQVTEFGGDQIFRPYYEPHIDNLLPSKSFASGHASLGYYFFALILLGKLYRSRLIFWLGFGLAWGLGILLSLARVVQGGHFLSDTLASALIMWLTAWGLAFWLFRYTDEFANKDEKI